MRKKKIDLTLAFMCLLITAASMTAAAIANQPTEWVDPEAGELPVAVEIAEETEAEGESAAPLLTYLEPEAVEDTRILTELNLPVELENQIDKAAGIYNLPADLVRGVIWTESRGVIDADNGQCYGLMQLNVEFADAFMDGAHVDSITDPKSNILAGCWWLSELMEWAEGEEDLAIMAYNLGQTGALRRWEAGERSTKYSETVQAARTKF